MAKIAEPVATPAIAPLDRPVGVAEPVGSATLPVDDELSVVSSGSYWNNAVQTSIRYIRPATPKLVPIAVCLGTIPLLIVLSIAAGWVVYSGIAVGWKSPLHLQYGSA